MTFLLTRSIALSVFRNLDDGFGEVGHRGLPVGHLQPLKGRVECGSYGLDVLRVKDCPLCVQKAHGHQPPTLGTTKRTYRHTDERLASRRASRPHVATATEAGTAPARMPCAKAAVAKRVVGRWWPYLPATPALACPGVVPALVALLPATTGKCVGAPHVAGGDQPKACRGRADGIPLVAG